MRFKSVWSFLVVGLITAPAMAHHGGVSLAFGPGSPIDTNSPLTLPQGGFVVSMRSEQVAWRKYAFAEPENKSSFSFYNAGLSYGATPWLTTSVFLPYNTKRQDSLGSASGIGDVRFLFTLGLNHGKGEGFHLNKQSETAVTLEGSDKSYLSFYGGVTAPTGKDDVVLGDSVDPGMQPGFGSPSYSMGASAARHLFGSFTLVADTSYDVFTERDDFKFGNEYRFSLAGVDELYGNPNAFLSKLDGVIELNLLQLARDQESGEGLSATGGTILYASPGLRFSFPKLWNANLGVLCKVPAWKNLNEKDEQQGAEGLEKFRLVTTLSFYF